MTKTQQKIKASTNSFMQNSVSNQETMINLAQFIDKDWLHETKKENDSNESKLTSFIESQ